MSEIGGLSSIRVSSMSALDASVERWARVADQSGRCSAADLQFLRSRTAANPHIGLYC